MKGTQAEKDQKKWAVRKRRRRCSRESTEADADLAGKIRSFDTVEKYIPAEDFTEDLYREVAQILLPVAQGRRSESGKIMNVFRQKKSRERWHPF